MFRRLVFFGVLGIDLVIALVVVALAAVFLFLLLVFRQRFVRGIATAHTRRGPSTVRHANATASKSLLIRQRSSGPMIFCCTVVPS